MIFRPHLHYFHVFWYAAAKSKYLYFSGVKHFSSFSPTLVALRDQISGITSFRIFVHVSIESPAKLIEPSVLS